VLVQGTSPCERNQCADHPSCVGPVREEEEIRSRADRRKGAEDRVPTPENRERIRDGDPFEPRAAKQQVSGLIERGAPRSEAWVERVPNHHARNTRPHRFAKGRELSGYDVGTDMRRFVGRDPSRSQAGEVLHASARAARVQPAGERANAGLAKWRDPSGPPRRSRTGARSTSTPARRRASPVARPARNALRRFERRAAAVGGGSLSKVEDVPPSWSTNTRAPFGLRSRTLWSCTSTPATP
jgi:hypothetical protein